MSRAFVGTGIVIGLTGFLSGGAQGMTIAEIRQTPYLYTRCLAEPSPLLWPRAHASHSSVYGGEYWYVLPLSIWGGSHGGLVCFAVPSIRRSALQELLPLCPE